MSEMSDFQKQFMSRGTGAKLFTQTEFDEAMTLAQAKIMAVAIDTTKQVIFIERQACAEIAYNIEHQRRKDAGEPEDPEYRSEIGEAILNRIPNQRQ